MTIMLAGGMVIGAPSLVPEAAAAGQLYVSAENAAFGNTFGGGQIVEIIVQDPSQSDTDVEESEPTVELNGDTVRMTQGADGYWYAYVADTAGVALLDGTGDQYGYDFGTSLVAGASIGDTATGTSSATGTVSAADITITNGGGGYSAAPTVAFTDGACTSTPTGTATLTDGVVTAVAITGTGTAECDGTETITFSAGTQTSTIASGAATTYVAVDVLGGEPTLSPDADNSHGLTALTWPFVQTYDLTAGGTEIVLEQAGSDEVVVLDYSSMEDFAGIEIDRTAAPQGAEVHLTITDGQLNIDPTAEETITFNYSTGAVSTGDVASDTDISTVNGCDTNCTLLIDIDANGSNVLVQDATDDDTVLTNLFLTFTESSSNSGIWSNTDDNDDASLNIVATATRGTTATIDYNDSAQSLSVAHDFATIDLDESTVGDEWNSGESMTIVLYDQCTWRNTRSINANWFSIINQYRGNRNCNRNYNHQ